MTRREKQQWAGFYAARMLRDGAPLSEAVNRAAALYGLSENQRWLLRRDLRRTGAGRKAVTA